MKTLRMLAVLFGLLIASQANLFSQIHDIKVFLEQCPTNDPAIDTILSDFQFRLNDQIVTDFPCTEPVSAMNIADYTQPLIYLQTLRVAYYMDRHMTGHLPWTDTTLYGWIRRGIDGVKVSDNISSGAYCCDVHDGKIFMVVPNSNDANRELDKTWRGISGNLDLVAHETRHMDGNYGHTDCCPSTSCDSTYNEENLSCFGIQYWLHKNWLTGFFNVGARTSHTNDEVIQIINWHLGYLDETFSTRFCYNPPEVIDIRDIELALGPAYTNTGEIPEAALTVYPNPVKNYINLKNQGTVAMNAEITITDLSGHLMFKKVVERFSPSGEHRIPVSDLANGFYLLTVRSKNQSRNYKIIKE